MSDHDPAARPAEPFGRGQPPTIEGVPEPADAPVPARPVRRGGTPLPLTLLLTAALGGGLYYVWAFPKTPTAEPDPGALLGRARAEAQSQVQPVADQLGALAGRVDALEKRPAPSAPDEGAAGLSKQVADLSAKVDALAAKQDSQAAAIQKAMDIAAQRPAGEAAAAPPDMTAAQAPALAAQQQVADLNGKLDAAVARQAAAEQALAQQKAADQALEERLSKLEAAGQEQAQAAATASLASRVSRLEQGAGAVQGAAETASRAVRLQAAEAALAAGQPLGTLPGAGPALARYATQRPPTDAGLRARFPAVAEAARQASEPDVSHETFLDRMLARVQQSVTVRRGDRVIVGDPASGVLARAQEAVDRDDLQGALEALATLKGPAADAVADWVAQARGLLGARAALAAMARG